MKNLLITPKSSGYFAYENVTRVHIESKLDEWVWRVTSVWVVSLTSLQLAASAMRAPLALAAAAMTVKPRPRSSSARAPAEQFARCSS